MLVRLFAFFLFCSIMPLFTEAQNRYDILITECLPDPIPTRGLPESEFIELKNCSSHDYNLHNWKIANANISATIKTDYLLKADSFLILCPTTSAVAYSHFGPTLEIGGFPSLNNDEGQIILSSESG